ncbi:MAG: hypothetical protein LBR58_08480 [Propionibacteriaceae bacterium]|nr:hypothetical protein [Propionibacteriaceae bacterium]
MIIAVVAFVPLLIADIAVSHNAILPMETPTLRVFDPGVVWPADAGVDAIQAAQFMADDPQLVTDCRMSRWAVIHLSGTGMETSHYAAGMLDPVVRSLGGCSMYLWYGRRYDADAAARVIAEQVEQWAYPWWHKELVLAGASFGGIAAEEIAASQILADAGIVVRGVIMESTPTDLSDVSDASLATSLVKWAGTNFEIQDAPGDYVPVIMANAMGQRQLGKYELRDFEDSWRNTVKTYPQLMWSQIAGIKRGMTQLRADVPVAYIFSDSDQTVKVAQASGKVKQLFAEVTAVQTTAVPHAGCWLAESREQCWAAYGQALEVLAPLHR